MINGKEYSFLVVERLHPDIILGRPYLRHRPERLLEAVNANISRTSPVPAANAVSDVFRTSLHGNIYHVDTDNRLVLDCPLFESANVMPREVPTRLRNPTNDSILNWFLGRMVNAGYLEECGENDVVFRQIDNRQI